MSNKSTTPPDNKKLKVHDQIAELEKELSKTKYNKRTQHHIGLVKAKIAKLKERQETRRKSGPKFEGYSVKKSGDASVVLLGFPSVGKSTLLNSLTDAESEVGAYEFTTLSVIPGVLEYKGAKIQILDVPGIVRGAASGRGRGKEVLSVLRNADLVLIIIDVFHPEHLKVLEKEIYDSHIRINQEKPDVKIVKTTKGGIQVGSTVRLTKINTDTIKAIMREFKISNAQIVIRNDISDDELIDAIEKNKEYLPGIIAINKIDLVDEDYKKMIIKKINPDIVISANEKYNIDELKELIFKKLDFIRIYCKETGKKADLEEPLIMKKNSTIKNVCTKLHKDFVNKFRFAKIWGKSAKFPGQFFKKLNKTLKDEDIVEIHIK